MNDSAGGASGRESQTLPEGLITNSSRKAKEIIALSQAPREVVDPTLPRFALRVQDLTIAQDAHKTCLQQETLNIDDSASICDKVDVPTQNPPPEPLSPKRSFFYRFGFPQDP